MCLKSKQWSLLNVYKNGKAEIILPEIILTVRGGKMNIYNFANIFKERGNWYKGCLHIHTTNSDGDLSPQEHASIYKEKGYDFLNFADHEKITFLDTEGRDEITTIPGIEISFEKYHLVVLNVEDEFDKNQFSHVQQIIDYARGKGGEVILAHPYWSSLSTEEVTSLQGLLGIEAFNGSAFLSIGKGNNEIYWDIALEKGIKLWGFCCDDSHYHFNEHRPVDTGYTWVMVKSNSLTPESLMESLRKGAFYSSYGPQIRNLEIQKGSIYVETSPVSSITFIANSPLGERFASPQGGEINWAQYQLKGGEKYIRVKCQDKFGRCAFLNPIFLED